MTHRERKIMKNKVREEKGMICHYCGCDLNFIYFDEKMYTLDHIVPKSKGGTDDIDNLVPACKRCNEVKDSMDYEDFCRKVKLFCK